MAAARTIIMIRGDRTAAEQAADPAWAASAQTLKREPGSVVLRGTMTLNGAPREVVVKQRALTMMRRALARIGLRTQGMRHWDGAAWLTRTGVETAAPIALCHTTGPGGASEVLVMECLHGRSLLEHLDDLCRGRCAWSGAERAALAVTIGAQIDVITRAGRFNRDHKPSNLIVIERSGPRGAAAGGGHGIAVIDCVGIRRDRLRIGSARMLASLMIEPMGLGRPAPRTLRMRCLRGLMPEAGRAPRKAAWRAVAELIARHGDPTPRVDPLARGPGRNAE